MLSPGPFESRSGWCITEGTRGSSYIVSSYKFPLNTGLLHLGLCRTEQEELFVLMIFWLLCHLSTNWQSPVPFRTPSAGAIYREDRIFERGEFFTIALRSRTSPYPFLFFKINWLSFTRSCSKISKLLMDMYPWMILDPPTYTRGCVWTWRGEIRLTSSQAWPNMYRTLSLLQCVPYGMQRVTPQKKSIFFPLCTGEGWGGTKLWKRRTGGNK